ncbi:hypothetical protein FB45DRAFT_859801 [Roridomyces roridus]|uniref:Uncharacterized protein n=1 Tax=Roridomyces roridus TaxID=1738132 RepID=A0AAD7CKQ2_9AGAR|nr:hypothetical protein FB45DRAFT_859801 [Roridomyces roridus]
MCCRAWAAGGYDYVRVHRQIVELFEEDPEEPWVVETLEWLTQRVFPADSINGGDEEEEEDDDISATNIILAQRRARKAAREAAQRDDEEQEDSTTPANPSGSSTAGSSGASASAHGRIRRSFFPLCSLGIIIQDRNSFLYPNVIHFPTHTSLYSFEAR